MEYSPFVLSSAMPSKGWSSSGDYTLSSGGRLQKALGGWWIGPGGEQIFDPAAWEARQKEQNMTLADFMASIGGSRASGVGGGTPAQNPFQPGLSDYEARMKAFLDTPSPSMDTSNRFEQGLSDYEGRLRDLLTNPDALKKTAGYQFQLNQGTEATQRALAKSGLLRSGNRALAVNEYAQGLAGQRYDTEANRLSDLVGKYSGSWLGDKNANTQKFAAESQAWNQRGGLLQNILSDYGTQWNRAYGTNVGADVQREKMAQDYQTDMARLWSSNRPQKSYASGGLDMRRFRPAGFV